MAKKQMDPKVRLALDEHRWINTPVVYTRFGSNCTSLQQDIMLQVAGRLQGHIQQFLNEKRYKSNELPKSVFTEEYVAGGIDPIKIDLNDLGVQENHFDRMDAVKKAIQELWVKAPSFDENTGLRNGEKWYPIFDEVFIPYSSVTKEGKEYKYISATPRKDENGEEIGPSRRYGYIEVHINAKVAAYVFDMSKGYINHLERIAFFCQSAYTSRIYLLLMQYVSRGDMQPMVLYFDLRDFLGMIIRKPKSDIIDGQKYEKFSQFRKQVLDVAQRDMERLAKDNKTEITFTYEPVYRGRTKRGNPDGIRFFIKRTTLGIARESELHRPKMEEHLCQELLKIYPTLERQSLLTVMQSVPDNLFEAFKNWCYNDLPRMVERPHRWDGTHESFVVWCMEQWLKTANTQNRETTRNDTNREPSLFDNRETTRNDTKPLEPLKPETLKSETSFVPDEYRDCWERFMNEYDGPLKPMLLKAEYRGTDQGWPWIQFPTKADVDAYNDYEEHHRREEREMMEVFRHCFPQQASRILRRGYRELK